MIKTILVPVTGYPSDNAALETAYLAARLFGAHIEALHVRPDWAQIAARAISPDVVAGIQSEDYFAAFEKEIKSHAWRAHRHVAEFCSRRGIMVGGGASKDGVAVSWRELEGDAIETVTAQARFHDLVVIGRAPESIALSPARLGAVMLGAGRPLLLAPEHAPENLAPTVAIAWKESREAAHAVTAAMPFLHKAEKVVVLGVEEGGHADKTTQSAERLAGQLRWHGLTVESHVVPLADGIAETLAQAAVAKGADLLVMGGYGHSRLREFVLGGATRGVLHACPIPVLLCH